MIKLKIQKHPLKLHHWHRMAVMSNEDCSQRILQWRGNQLLDQVTKYFITLLPNLPFWMQFLNYIYNTHPFLGTPTRTKSTGGQRWANDPKNTTGCKIDKGKFI
jgi:hypothetical protein